jgi:hypothetical protein
MYGSDSTETSASSTTSTDTTSTSTSTTTAGTSADVTSETGGATTTATEGGSTEEGGSETGVTPGSTCEMPNDCTLVDDCCTCAGIHVDDTPPPCDVQDCDVTMCAEHGIGMMVECDFGACQLDETTCNVADVLCDSLPPPCPEGWLPEVSMGCWAGGCVPAEACDVVPDCSWCGANEACLEIVAGVGTWSACAPIPPECDGTPTCACLGEACPMPFDSCAEGDEGLSCSCPNCAGGHG